MDLSAVPVVQTDLAALAATDAGVVNAAWAAAASKFAASPQPATIKARQTAATESGRGPDRWGDSLAEPPVPALRRSVPAAGVRVGPGPLFITFPS